VTLFLCCVFFFSSRRRHTRCYRDWSSDVCSSDLEAVTVDLGGTSSWCTGVLLGPQVVLTAARCAVPATYTAGAPAVKRSMVMVRSEERRVGKEGRSRWWLCDWKRK